MTRLLAQARFIIGALALALILGISAPAFSQQPTQVNPTASSVKEEQLLKGLQLAWNLRVQKNEKPKRKKR